MVKSSSEDDLKTFEGWLRDQAFDASTMTGDHLAMCRDIFDEVHRQRAANPKVGLMKLRPVPGEYKYAVAVREGGDLWVTLWVRRSWKGEFFIMIPRGDPSLDVHTSYHRDGALHMKSHDRKAFKSYRRQPLTGVFRGSVDLGNYHGHGAESVGAICDATAFSGVVEVAPGVLGRAHGAVGVFLVEPGLEPPDYALTHEIVTQSVFRDVTPNVVITVLRDKSLKG